MAGKTNLYELSLLFLSDEFVFRNLDRVLDPIGHAIESCGEYMDKLDPNTDSMFLEHIAEEEGDVIENLLGTAFVVCQTYITATVRGVRVLHKRFTSEHPDRTLATTSTKKPDIMVFGSPRVGTTGYTGVEILNAFANYFKHGDEWGHGWISVHEKGHEAASILESVGAPPGSSDSFRDGATALGNPEHYKLRVFASILREWRISVLSGYRIELASLGLVRERN